jgi:hypothetical protein
MKRFVVVVLLCYPVFGQATYSGTGNSRGTATYGVNAGQLVMGVGENAYCPAAASGELTEGTPTWGAVDGVANLPAHCMNTAVASTPSPGYSHTPATASDLNTLLSGGTLNGHTLACGDSIVLAAGSRYTASSPGFTFPALTCDGAHWITVKSSGVVNVNFPAEGTRATPCIGGLANDATNGRQVPGYPDYACASYPAVLTAKLQAPSLAGGYGAITFASGANHYRFIGVEVLKYPGVRPSQLITLAPDSVTLGANHIIFDRYLIHGDAWTTSSDIYTEVQAGMNAKNSQWVALVDGWNYDTYCNSACVDSQGFSAGTGAYQDGPFKLYNNLIATAGETYMLGGGGQGIGTPNTQDFEYRANHSFKPLGWMVPIESCAVYYAVPVTKNLGEFKNGVRALLEGNVYENNWQGCQSDQTGDAQIIAAKNQNNKASMVVNFDGSSTVTRVSGSPWLHTCGNNPNCRPDDASNCPPGGCVLEINDASRGSSDNGVGYRFCNGANGCSQPNDLTTSTTATLTSSVAAGSGVNVYSCVPGDCPSCRIQHVTARLNEIYNVNHGFTISSGRSSHCLDESAGTDHIEIRDNLLHGLSVEASNGSDPMSGSSAISIGNGQVGAIINTLEIAHNTVAIEQGNSNGFGGLGSQTDFTDLQYLSGINIHDNISPQPWIIAHTNGTIMNGGLATGYQTQSCQQYYPGQAPGGIVVAGNLSSFTFSPSLASYIVTVNGVSKSLSASTSTSFTLSAAAHAGDSITVRDLNTCNWTFAGNLIGLTLPGSGKDNSPYPTSNTSTCGPANNLSCLLDEATPGAFTNNFKSWGTGRSGDFTLAPSSPYLNSATDAGSRASTGKNPGFDGTLFSQLTAGVRGLTYYPALTVTTSSLAATAGTPYQALLQTNAGASPFKAWWVETDSTKCGGNCGTLPAGIVVGRSGTVNGPFLVLTASRAVAACGSAGTVACSTFILKQTVTGTPQVGQVIQISSFANGTGSQANDATFNGTCTIRVVTQNSFSCDQTGTGADTITSHQPHDLWNGQWVTGNTYNLNDQVMWGSVAYSSLQASNHGNQPDISPTYWQVYTLPANMAPGAAVSFAPTTPGTYSFWIGGRDGAFQKAWAQVSLTIATQ